MTANKTDDRLGALLRAGDPAADASEPMPEETAALRRLALNRVPERRPLTRWLPAAVATAALALAVVWLSPGGPSEPEGIQGTELAVEEPDQPRRQQIQFATENGTRIIWVLDPELTL